MLTIYGLLASQKLQAAANRRCVDPFLGLHDVQFTLKVNTTGELDIMMRVSRKQRRPTLRGVGKEFRIIFHDKHASDNRDGEDTPIRAYSNPDWMGWWGYFSKFLMSMSPCKASELPTRIYTTIKALVSSSTGVISEVGMMASVNDCRHVSSCSCGSENSTTSYM